MTSISKSRRSAFFRSALILFFVQAATLLLMHLDVSDGHGSTQAQGVLSEASYELQNTQIEEQANRRVLVGEAVLPKGSIDLSSHRQKNSVSIDDVLTSKAVFSHLRKKITERKLLRSIDEMAQRTHVVYVWGGRAIGTRETCDRCRACVKRKNVPSKKRFERCGYCRECGVDCSNLVNLIYRSAGLGYDWASTSMLWSRTSLEILRDFSLVDLGEDISQARPGDLLLYTGHVVMMASGVREDGTGDIIHSQSGAVDGIGGIVFDAGKNLRSAFGGGEIRLLRHTELMDSPTAAELSPPKEIVLGEG